MYYKEVVISVGSSIPDFLFLLEGPVPSPHTYRKTTKQNIDRNRTSKLCKMLAKANNDRRSSVIVNHVAKGAEMSNCLCLHC